MTLRFGIVGAGGIAGAYGLLFDDVPDAELVVVADRDPVAAARFGERFGVAVAADLDAALAMDLDAVVVCTPPVTHPEITLAAVDRRIAVLCEKPLAIDVASARRMLGEAAAAGVLVTMATKFRFVPDLVHARALVDGGTIGDVIHIENTFASRVDMTHRWNCDAAVSGGGVLIDNGTHSVDITRSFLGPIREVLAVEHPRVQPIAVEDGAQLLARAASGATATIDLSWSYDNASDVYLQLYGTDGAIRIGWHGAGYRANSGDGWTSFGSGYDKLTCMRGQVVAFGRALRGEEAMAVTDRDAVASVRVIEAAYRSLRAGDWVTVDPVQPLAADEGVA